MREVTPLLGTALAGAKPLDSSEFAAEVRAALFASGTKSAGYKTDRLLNRMISAFIIPPHQLYRAAVLRDFQAARATPLSEIIAWLFTTTAYYFDHADALPQFSGLVTFRDIDAGA